MTFYFSETVKVFSNPTLNNQSSNNSNSTKTNRYWLNHLHTHTHMRVRARTYTNTHTHTHTHTHAKLHHLAEGLRRSFHPYTRKSWTHPTSAFPWLTLETKKIECWIHPASAFLLVTPGSKGWYHLQGGKGYGMWLIVGQFPIMNR